MIWSISESRTFRRCQRQWYYKNFVANAIAKDRVRHTAYLLGKLQTISAWRETSSTPSSAETIFPAVRARRIIGLDEARASRPQQIFDRQLAFGQRHPLHEPGLSPTQLGDDFAAFYRWSIGPSKVEIERAWAEVERATRESLRDA